MRASILFFVLALAACSSKTITQPLPEVPNPETWDLHYFFDRYLTAVDSTGDRTIYTYDKLSLVRVHKFFEVTYVVKNDTVFVGNHSESDYQVEIFKKDYLVISMVNGRSGAAGPDYFPRDNTIFISFETGEIKTAKLPHINFTRSYEFLMIAHQPGKDSSPGNYFAIDSIDFINNRLVLIGDNGLTYDHPLKSFEGTFRFGTMK